MKCPFIELQTRNAIDMQNYQSVTIAERGENQTQLHSFLHIQLQKLFIPIENLQLLENRIRVSFQVSPRNLKGKFRIIK